MPNVKYKEVSRAFVYYIDEVNRQIHGLFVQRPPQSAREADKLSLFGGTNDPEDLEGFSHDQVTDRFLLHLLWHLQNELGINEPLEAIAEIDASVNLETNPPKEEPNTFINWTTVNYMIRLNEMKSFEDLQPFKNVPRPIEWFTVNIDDPDGVIFRQDGKTLVPLRPINGKEPSEGFGPDEIAFDQYQTITAAVEKIKEIQKAA